MRPAIENRTKSQIVFVYACFLHLKKFWVSLCYGWKATDNNQFTQFLSNCDSGYQLYLLNSKSASIKLRGGDSIAWQKG